MSLPVTVTFMLADWIIKGIADGTLERVGGVIREVGSKHIVTWLREPGSSTGNQLGELGRSMQLTQGILQVSSTVSILNLGVSVIGFAVILQRLKELEQRLQQAQKLLNHINRKIDVSFYANFRAALDLAVNAFTMTKIENRRSSALQAINRFLEAEHIYTEFADIEIEQQSQIADEYLLTLSLAYLAEARCYLELEEHDTALRRFQEGSRVIRSRIQKYVKLLLTYNPAVYLQPQFRGQIDLRRLTRIYQWLDPTLNENAVFDMQRMNLFMLAKDPNKWIESIPAAIWDSKVDWVGKAIWDDPKPQIYARLPKTLEVMESMIETNRRFESYQTEVQAISQLEISFHDWLKLTPSTEIKPDGAELMYIIPSKPLELQPSI
ncbi:MAG: tetratricopeptide repeat protein [Nostoc sp.]|uniref:tetratricopeptide repeat protein n=1 Tax=Nostoc sp. TaxID=1180 RepID=UPI002FF47E79